MKKFLFITTLLLVILLPVQAQNSENRYIAKVIWSPDGHYLAVLERGNERITIYDATLQIVTRIENFPDNYLLMDVAWNAESTQVVIGIEEFNRAGIPIIEVWDIPSSKRIFSYRDESPADAGPLAVAWRPHSQQIVYSDGDVDKVINLDSGMIDYVLIDDLRRPVYNLSWSYDGNYLAGVATTGIYLWDADSYTLAQTLLQDNVPIEAVWSNSSLNIATGNGNVVNIWNIQGEVIQTLTTPENISLYLLEWEGKYLAAHAATQTFPRENILLVWDISAGELINAIKVDDPITDFTLHPTEPMIVYGSNGLTLKAISILTP